MDDALRPDPWILDNPELAGNVGLADSTASIAAAAAVLELRGIAPVDEDEDDLTPEEEAVHEAVDREAVAAYQAGLTALAKDPAVRGITIGDFVAALKHA